MAGGKSYSAGRIFLQVVPSFKNLQKDIEREVKGANRGVEKEHEEAGKRAAEARQRGERKVADRAKRRASSATGGLDPELEARIKAFQRYSQAMIGERVKESKRQLAEDRRNGGYRLNLWKATNAAILSNNKLAAREREALERRNAKYAANLADMLRKGELRAYKDAEAAKTKAKKDAEAERHRLAKKNLDLEIADRARANKAEADLANRAEARRKVIRQRRITQRLADMRAEAAERARLSGGEAGSRIRKGAKGAADAIGIMRIDADSSAAKVELAALRERLLELSKTDIGVDIDTATAMAEIETISKRLDMLARQSPDVDVDVNATAALVMLKRVEQQVDQINRKRATGAFLGMFSGLSSSAEDGANSFRLFNPVILAALTMLPLLPPLLASAAAGIGALSTAAIGGAAGLGVMVVGFSGLFDAVSAMGDVESNRTKDALSNSKAIRTALKGLRDAEQGVAQARTRNARATEDAARRTADARRNVGDVEARVARDIKSALKSQEDAERALARSQRDATQAQLDLVEARAQAQRDQDALADRIAGGKLDERQALIDLFNAQVDYNAAMADGSATNLDREQAAIAFERAKLAIKGVREENAALIAEQKAGVAGNENVARAQERVADAAEGVRDAQERAAEAEASVQRARVDGARDIADAQRAVGDALRDQAETAADNAIAQRDAQERLTDAQAAYQEALTKTGDVGSASVAKLEEALGKLGPAGRDFAFFIFSLRDGFYAIRDIIQAGMLPPLMAEMKELIDVYGPGFKDFVGVMGRTIGLFFTVFGEAMRSPVMREFFETMAIYAPIFFTQFGDLFINILKVIAGLATAFAPFAKDFMDAFVDMSAGWAEWAEGLSKSDGFAKFIEYVREEGPKLLQLFKDIFTIIINIGKGMSESGAFDAILGFFSFLADLDPTVIATLFNTLVGLFVASQVAAGINALVISFGLLVGTPVGLFVLAIGALIAGIVLLYNNSEAFRAFVDDMWIKIKGYWDGFLTWIRETFIPWWTGTAMPIITAVFSKIAEVAKWLWENILAPLFRVGAEMIAGVFRIIVGYWNAILWPMLKLWGSVMMWLWEEVGVPVFGALGTLFKGMVDVIVWVWDNVLKGVFEAIALMLEGDFTGAWETAVTAIGNLWHKLQELALKPVNFIIGTVLNDGLFKAFNSIMEFLGLGMRISPIPLLSMKAEAGSGAAASRARNKYAYDTGGYTGGGGKYDVAGIVHRDEFVLRKEATNSLRNIIGLEGLDFMNRTGRLPGYAIGGMVKPVNAPYSGSWGRYPRSGRTHRALDFPAPSGTPVVMPYPALIVRDGWDSTGFGNHIRAQFFGAGNGTYGIFGHLLREIVSVGQRLEAGQVGGYVGTTGNSTGNHLHFEMRTNPYDPSTAFDYTAAWRGGRSVTPAAGVPGVDLPWWADKPIELLRGAVNAGVSAMPFSGLFGDMVKGFPNKIFDGMRGFIGNLLGGGGPVEDDISGGKFFWNGREVADNGSQMYDNGGYIQPGVTRVLNMTGRPEPVFTADQYDRGIGGGGGALVGTYAPTFQGSDLTAADVLDEFTYTLNRVAHGGKYAGRTG